MNTTTHRHRPPRRANSPHLPPRAHCRHPLVLPIGSGNGRCALCGATTRDGQHWSARP